jgi:hypothetical protein
MPKAKKMKRVSLQILKAVAKRGELPLAAAIQMARRRAGGHLGQYPLALLLEDGYLGMTINHVPPPGAEEMREFSLATTLHMLTLPKGPEGATHYHGIRSMGSLNPEHERVFLKAKGALYLDELAQKSWDRLWSLTLGFIVGVLTVLAASWAKGQLKLP